MKPNTQLSGEFSRAREFSQTLQTFSPGYESTESMFYFFYKIIFRHDIQSAYVQFYFFHETVNFHNLETAKHIANVIFVLQTHLLTNQNARTIQIIL